MRSETLPADKQTRKKGSRVYSIVEVKNEIETQADLRVIEKLAGA